MGFRFDRILEGSSALTRGVSAGRRFTSSKLGKSPSGAPGLGFPIRAGTFRCARTLTRGGTNNPNTNATVIESVHILKNLEREEHGDVRMRSSQSEVTKPDQAWLDGHAFLGNLCCVTRREAG